MARIIEVARFRVRAGHEEQLIREHPAALGAIREAFPGLLGVRLIHLGGDVWADVAEWADEESAAAAKVGAMDLAAFAQWTRNIAEDLSLDHGAVRSVVERVSRNVA